MNCLPYHTDDPADYEKHIEGAGVLLNTNQTQYVQVFAATENGSVTLAGQHSDASFDAGQFLGQQIQRIADRTRTSYQEVAELCVQKAQTLNTVSVNDEQS